MKKLRVLHVVMAKIWGGGEQYVYDVCKEMQRQGHTVFVAVDGKNDLLQQRYAEVATVITANLYFAAGIFSINALKKEIIDQQLDIINCHSGHGVLLCLMLKFLTHKKLVLFKHNAIPAKIDSYHRWVRKNIDAVICVSQLVFNLQTQDLNAEEKSKFHLVYNGIDLKKFNKYTEVPKNNSEFIIGYAGRLAPNKGIDVLLQSFALLYKQYKNVRLKIVGADETGYLEQVNNIIRQLGLQNVAEYGGVEKDMEKFYKSLDVLVLPSVVREAFGLVLCEAMYCGVPVITTNSGAQEEIIDDGIDGIIVQAGDIQELYVQMKILYVDELERTNIILQGVKKVEANFTITNCVDNIMRCYLHIKK